jgi:hypothetical protein
VEAVEEMATLMRLPKRLTAGRECDRPTYNKQLTRETSWSKLLAES